MKTKSLKEHGLAWVTINKSWDHYEGNWDNEGAETFEAGAKFMLEMAHRWCKADHESSFNPNLSSWRLYDYLKTFTDEVKP